MTGLRVVILEKMSRAACRRFLLATGYALMLLLVSRSGTAQTLIVLSDVSAAYQEVAEEVRAGLNSTRAGRMRVDIATAAQLAISSSSTATAYELVVTIGLSAAQAAIERHKGLQTPPATLSLLIPQQSFEKLALLRAGGRDRQLSAVFINQPLSRQLDLIRLVLPDKRRIGVIFGPGSQGAKSELKEKAAERNMSVRFAEVAEASAVYGALKEVLPESDVLLALPDPVAINSATAFGLLLTSYRAQVPVVGFSEGLVTAGALVSLFSTAGQVGKQGAEIARRFFTDEGVLPAPQHPKYFSVRVNTSVARSLGIEVANEAALAASLSSRNASPGDGPRPSTDVPAPRRSP